MTPDEISQQNDINKKSHSVKKRLSFMLLDVFFGGFIVSVILLVTLGRPDAENPAVGAGGAPIIVVEYFWKNKHRLLSPLIAYNGENLSVPGFASPWGATNNGLWYGHDADSGRLDYTNLKKPFSFIIMDGFHLDPNDLMVLQKNSGSTADENIYYAQLIVSTPCAGSWQFGVRSVEQGISAGHNRVDLDIRISFSYGPGNKTVQPEELIQLYRGQESVNKKHDLFDTMKNEKGKPVMEKITLPPEDALKADYC